MVAGQLKIELNNSLWNCFTNAQSKHLVLFIEFVLDWYSEKVLFECAARLKGQFEL
jgi:hypothetical protein